MSNILSKVTTGKIRKPIFMLLYGPPGRGKTYFAAHAPKTIFIGNEEGSYNLDVARAPAAKSYDEVMGAIEELRSTKHDYQTLAIDSLTGIEPLIWNRVCKDQGRTDIKSIEDIGYKKGYIYAVDYWREMVQALLSLREERGMHIIAIAHSIVKSYNDPMLVEPYDKHLISLHDKAVTVWAKDVDVIGFTNFEVLLKTDRESEKRNRAMDGDRRILYCQGAAGYDAKNRYSMPKSLDLDWKTFESAWDQSQVKVPSKSELLSELNDIKAKIPDEKTVASMTGAIEKAGDDVSKLLSIKKHALTIVGA